ncbi:dicarboxylate/amino acid:cation symporter [Chitinophaga agrisoli]|uniref:Dicarboxylate/amino acid:cation symporter n=1 Tax=Chitinophaga agrisoli TaxID=2607653 RepID=A0A5B2VX30_9BACT|nr:dicarboxylate/amino acid:cation symporter [Chitinophaga agrisoli]KAA2243150.1 dicarboxylate/amino acid:cation symporter [Chitinophaga agrisoli]
MNGTFLKNYGDIIWLLAGIIAGSVLGLVLGPNISVLKPVGDIFLNLLFTAVIPLVFFAIASAIGNVDRSQRPGRVIAVMMMVFVGTVLVAAFLTIVTIWIFPIHQQVVALPGFAEKVQRVSAGDQLTELLTTSEFFQLLSRKSMLPLIIFAVLVGTAVLQSGDSGEPFRRFLNSGNEVMKRLIILIMKLGPVGLGAYFAYQVGTLGPQLFGIYARSMAVYYGFGLFYFIVLFSVYAFIAGGVNGIKKYWKNNVVPSLTAVGTCSSIATIPANLEAAPRMGVPGYISNIVVPLGATLHKDGSSISSIVKIAVVFTMFGRSLTGVDTVLLALGITVIVSIVEGGVPNGAYIGELLMVSVYGFPPEALPPAMIIGTLVDPLATLLNATGDTVAAMMVTRFMKARPDPHPVPEPVTAAS